MRMDKKEAFAVLGLSPECSEEQAKKRYRELAKKFHPDRVQDKNHRLAENRMKEVNAAFRMVLPYLVAEKHQNKPRPKPSSKTATPVKDSINQFKKQFFGKMNTLFNGGHQKQKAPGSAESARTKRPAGDFDEILRKYASQFSKSYSAEAPPRKRGRFRKTQTHQYKNYIQLQKRYTAAAKKRSRARGIEPVGPIRPVSRINPVEKT